MDINLEQILDNFYQTDRVKYEEKLTIVKSMGYRVFRNSEGKHIIKYDLDDALNRIDQFEKERRRNNMKAFMDGLLGRTT